MSSKQKKRATPEEEANVIEDVTARCVPHPDTERLNWLEQMIRSEGGMVLHVNDYNRAIKSAPGLGLMPGSADRNLRKAIDQARGVRQ